MKCNCVKFSSTYVRPYHFDQFTAAFLKGFGCIVPSHQNPGRTEAAKSDWDTGRKMRLVWNDVTKDSSCYAFSENCPYGDNLKKIIWFAAVEWRKRKDRVIPLLKEEDAIY